MAFPQVTRAKGATRAGTTQADGEHRLAGGASASDLRVGLLRGCGCAASEQLDDTEGQQHEDRDDDHGGDAGVVDDNQDEQADPDDEDPESGAVVVDEAGDSGGDGGLARCPGEEVAGTGSDPGREPSRACE